MVSATVIGMTAATIDVANEVGVILESEVRCKSISRIREPIEGYETRGQAPKFFTLAVHSHGIMRSKQEVPNHRYSEDCLILELDCS